MRQFLYVTEKEAIANGMTHEGRLFGVPAWLRVDSEVQVTGTPKVPVLHLWCWLVDVLLELGSWLIPEGSILVSPISVGRRIAP